MLYSWSTFLDYPRYARFTALIRLRSPAFYRPPFARSRTSSPLFLISHFQTNKKNTTARVAFFLLVGVTGFGPATSTSRT